MEREVVMSGIGGQGIQLAAKTLAVAAVHDVLDALVFGVYGGSMRGGNTESTVILGQGQLLTPPVVDQSWSCLVMHPQGWKSLAARLRPGGFALVDIGVFRELPALEGVRLLSIDATTIATTRGHPQTASMIALGAFVSATRIVSLEALRIAAEEVLPQYRIQHARHNVEALEAGFCLVADQQLETWTLKSDTQKVLA